VRSGAGASAGAITATVDAFRADLGGANNGDAGSFSTGRREINWDGVPTAFAAPSALPGNFFNANFARGAVLSTPGTGFQVSGSIALDGANALPEFTNINASYDDLFTAFSSPRLFTALGSTITDVNFFVPGTATPALVSGFGAVFTDVDLADTTSIQFFAANGASLGTFFVPPIGGNETLSFLGVSFTEGPVVARVRITSGNQVLSPTNTLTDLVVMDDFIYGEPQAATAAVPLPAAAWGGMLLLGGLVGRRIASRRPSSPAR
jgi:hypothetical protein